MKNSSSWTKLFLTILAVLLYCTVPTKLRAEDVRHTFAGTDLNSFYIDDRGGSVNNGGSDNSYFLNLLDIDQSAFGTLLLYSQNGNQTQVEDGLMDEDFGENSGIELFDLSVLPNTNAAGEIGLSSADPLTPVHFQGNLSGLRVEQVSYTSANPEDGFALIEYRVINPTNQNIDVRLALSNDFDVDLKSADAAVGFDAAGVPTVWQQESLPLDPNHTTIGVSLLRGALAQYRLEVCSGAMGSCQIFTGGDAIRGAYFQNTSGQVGDLTGQIPNQDFAVTLSAELGTLAPGASASAVFCYNIGQGETPQSALETMLNNSVRCDEFYEEQIHSCGNSLVNFGESCDDGNNDTSDNCPDGEEGSCISAFCGDGFLWQSGDGTEVCDDGNESLNDDCPSGPNGSCQDAFCGDGFVWNQGGGEQCDNGGANSDDQPDACRTNCQNPTCGDGVTDSNEQCDDADPNDHDACLNNCRVATCGDGVLHNSEGGSEECDNGAANSDSQANACRTNCQNPTCGDGVTDLGEGCDDGNNNQKDACLNSCSVAFCGDGFVRQGVEVCDTALSAQCSNNCTSFDSCGNGIIDPGENCDDGNNNTSDNCPDGKNGTCQSASCGDGYLRSTTEACDDGNLNDGDGCSSSCQNEGTGGSGDPISSGGSSPVCGNNIVEEGEECDDGNTQNIDGCNSQCFWELVLQGGGSDADSTGAGACQLNTGTTNATGSGLSFLLLLGVFGLWRSRKTV